MTIINMHPPMPPPQQPSMHPSDRSYSVYDHPAGPDHLAQYVNQLHLQQDKRSPANDARQRELADANEHGETYLGYTFYKAIPPSGHPATWKTTDRTKMNLSQDDLLGLVRRRARKLTSTGQYQSLSRVKRPHVDQLVEDLRQTKPQFHWTCAYVKEEQRNVKGKGYSLGDYETTSMDVILVGKAKRPPSSEAPVEAREQPPSYAQHTAPEIHQKPFAGHGPHTGAWSGSAYEQVPIPSQAPPMSTQGPPMATHGPSPVQQGPAQLWQHTHPPHPPQQAAMNETQYPEQSYWQQNMPTSQPQPAVTFAPDQMSHPPVSRPNHETHVHGGRKVTMAPEPMATGPHRHRTEKIRQSPAHTHQPQSERTRAKSPKQRPGSTPDLVYDSNSSRDDVNMPPEPHDEDSDAEFSSREAKLPRYRGSLYPSAKPSRRYRTHYRKDPDMIDDRALQRFRGESGAIIVPADSRHIARRANRYYGGNRQWMAQQGVVHHADSDDTDLLAEQLRGQAQNNIRSRMLKHWQADLEEREQLVEYHTQLIKESMRNDRINDIDLMKGPRPLREPLSGYHRGYLPRALQ
ncbi:hypothetical protein BJY04DRAFT_175581 [Aspergillus karnatakaensis]|uniref:uncharacterized protein n=1 Tax=Aspergillus karnatakaensis TaxID=1810916 RepID=UPI003CCCE239